MKDELNSITLEGFVGLRLKCYSLFFNGEVKDNMVKHTNPMGKQTAKGTKKSVKEARLRHQHYKYVLKNLSTVAVGNNVIKSKAHDIHISYEKSHIDCIRYQTLDM